MRKTGFPERLRLGVPGADHHPFAERGLICFAGQRVKRMEERRQAIAFEIWLSILAALRSFPAALERRPMIIELSSDHGCLSEEKISNAIPLRTAQSRQAA
jgi:hypothetical protein